MKHAIILAWQAHISRTESDSSEDHREYGEMLANMRTVCASDPNFKAALEADAHEQEVGQDFICWYA